MLDLNISDTLRFPANNRPSSSSSYCVGRWFFLKFLAAIYLIAFLSLWIQMDGLIGSHGILPAKDFLNQVYQQVGLKRYWLVPTIFWLDASDGFLSFGCAFGIFLSVFALVGFAQPLIFFFLWFLYLSFASVSGDFLEFQWDSLLLEAGFLSIFLAPYHLLPKGPFASRPSVIMLWMFRFLFFKLIFSSGAVKLSSGDPTWWNLTALTYHYETQPLPTWIGWYAHQLPVWFQKLSCLGTFAVELLTPFLIFGPRKLRLLACAANIGFQVFIMVTGNYCFFNLLTIALCFLLIDDQAWMSLLRSKTPWGSPKSAVRSFFRSEWFAVPVAVLFLVVTLLEVVGSLRVPLPWPLPMVQIYRLVSPFRTINGYGLFARMTTSRPEIIVEGSNDGETWLSYEFKWKLDRLDEQPRFVEPHQPRLDWQMWFAALGSYRENHWFINFLIRLLQGERAVLALLEKNPFPEAPPRYIRALVYDYHFTNLKIKKEKGLWWRRELKGPYCPILSLRAPTRQPFEGIA